MCIRDSLQGDGGKRVLAQMDYRNIVLIFHLRRLIPAGNKSEEQKQKRQKKRYCFFHIIHSFLLTAPFTENFFVESVGDLMGADIAEYNFKGRFGKMKAVAVGIGGGHIAV